MLGYIVADGRGRADELIFQVSQKLRLQGVSVAGAVQVNIDTDPLAKCEMDLHVLTGRDVVRISQNLGALSEGCRLDPEGLERAVGLVTKGLASGAEVLIINKFGKQEAHGRGFRPLIGEALANGVRVLTSVSLGNLEAFLDFAHDLAQEIPADEASMIAWCQT